MSLFDLPPYKEISASAVEKAFDRGGDVLPHFDASRAEVQTPGGATIFIDDGNTAVTIKTRFSLKQLVNYILET